MSRRVERRYGSRDPCEVLADAPDDLDKPVIDIADVKPGDFGEVTFDFALCDNPGWVWMNGELLENAENGVTEPETDAPGEDDVPGDSDTAGDLAEAIQVTIWYDEDCDNTVDRDEVTVEGSTFEGSLRDALTILDQGKGLPLDGLLENDERDCFEPETRHCIGFRWELPADHGNDVQSDSVTFDLGFYTEQCRHNPDEGTQFDVGPGGDGDYCIGTVMSMWGEPDCDVFAGLSAGDDICILCEDGECPYGPVQTRWLVFYCDEDDNLWDFWARVDIKESNCQDCPDGQIKVERI